MSVLSVIFKGYRILCYLSRPCEKKSLKKLKRTFPFFVLFLIFQIHLSSVRIPSKEKRPFGRSMLKRYKVFMPGLSWDDVTLAFIFEYEEN